MMINPVSVIPVKSNLLKRLALTATLMVSSALISPAAVAQKGTVLSPSTDWAVSKVAAKGDVSGYCALARRFNQNTILTLAKNGERESSIALDFQNPRFTTSDSVDVVLDAGAGEQRSFKVIPVSEKAFVVRLGKDGAFFDALRKTGYLRADVGGYVYGFNVSDIDAGQQNLDTCVADMAGGGASGAVSQTAQSAAVPAAETSSGGLSVAALEMQLGVVRDDNQRLKTKQETLQQENQSIRMELQKTEADYKAQVERLRAELEEQKQTGSQLELALNANKESQQTEIGKALATTRESNEIVQRLQQENDKLLQQMAQNKDEYSQSSGALQAALDRNDVLTKEMDKLRADNQAQIAELTKVLEAQKQEAQTLKTSLEAKEAESGTVLSRLQSQSAETATVIAQLEADNKRLQDAIGSGKTEQEQLLLANQAQIAELTKALEAQKQEAQTLKTSLEAKEAESGTALSRLQSQSAETATVIAQLEADNKKLQDMANTAKAESEKLRAENASLTASLQGQTTQMSEAAQSYEGAAKENAQLKADMTALQNRYDTEMGALKAELAALEQSNQEMGGKLETAKGAESEASGLLGKLKAEIEQVRGALLNEQKQNEALSALVNEKDSGHKDLLAQLDSAVADNQALKKKIAEAEGAQSQGMKELSGKIEVQEEERVKLSKALEDSQGRIAALESELAGANAKLAAKDEAVQGAEKSQTAYAKEIEGLRGQLASLDSENKALKATIDGNGQKENEVVQALSKENSDLKTALEAKGGENEKALASVMAENAQLKTSLEAKGGGNEKEILALREENAALKTALDASKNEGQSVSQDIRQEIEKREQRIAALESENKNLQAEMEKAVKAAEAGNSKSAIIAAQDKAAGKDSKMDSNKDSAKDSAQIAKLQEERDMLSRRVGELEAKVSAATATKAAMNQEEEEINILKMAGAPAGPSSAKTKTPEAASEAAVVAAIEPVKAEALPEKTEDVAQDMTVKDTAKDGAKKAEKTTVEAVKPAPAADNDVAAQEIARIKAENEALQAQLKDTRREVQAAKQALVETRDVPAAQQNAPQTAAAPEEQVVAHINENSAAVAAAPVDAASSGVSPRSIIDRVMNRKPAPVPETPDPIEQFADVVSDDVPEQIADQQREAAMRNGAMQQGIPEEKAEKLAEQKMEQAKQGAPKRVSEVSTVKQQPVAPDFTQQGMTEAQKMEQEMAQNMTAPVQKAAPTVAPQAIEPEPLSVTASAGNHAPTSDMPMQQPMQQQQAIGESATSASVAATPEVQTGKVYAPYALAGLLERAQVPTVGSVRLVEKESGAQKSVYQWREADGLFGSSEIQPLANDAQFDANVLSYLEKVENRCKGEVAIMPDNSRQEGAVRVDTYEVACVMNDVSSSASLVFFNGNGAFTVIAHEAPTDKMDMAMNARDRVAKAVSGGGV